MSQSEEEYEYGHQTEDEEPSKDEEVSLEELEATKTANWYAWHVRYARSWHV